MLFEELMKDEYMAGKEDGKIDALRESILGFLADIAPVSDGLRDRILSIEDLNTLTMLNKKSARVRSLEEFEKIEF